MRIAGCSAGQPKTRASWGNRTLYSREKWITILQQNKINGTKRQALILVDSQNTELPSPRPSLLSSNTSVAERKSNCEDLLPLQWALGDLSQIWNLSGLKPHRAGCQKWQKSKGPTGKVEHYLHTTEHQQILNCGVSFKPPFHFTLDQMTK